MVEIETTTISSKGQIVIPASMRADLKEGDKFLIIKDKSNFLLKKADDLDEKFKDDLEFSRRTEVAWKEIDEGKSHTYSLTEFKNFLRNG